MKRTIVALIGVGLVISQAGVLGFRFNLTRSLPLGVYRVTSAPPTRGRLRVLPSRARPDAAVRAFAFGVGQAFAAAQDIKIETPFPGHRTDSVLSFRTRVFAPALLF